MVFANTGRGEAGGWVGAGTWVEGCAVSDAAAASAHEVRRVTGCPASDGLEGRGGTADKVPSGHR